MIGPTEPDSAKSTPNPTGVTRSMMAKAAMTGSPKCEKTRIA